MSNDPHRLEAPIKAVLDATNTGNSQAFVAAFTKDGSVNDWGQVYVGRGEIGKWDRAENTSAGVKVKATGVSRIAGEVIVLVQVTKGDDTESGSWAFRLKGNAVTALEIG